MARTKVTNGQNGTPEYIVSQKYSCFLVPGNIVKIQKERVWDSTFYSYSSTTFPFIQIPDVSGLHNYQNTDTYVGAERNVKRKPLATFPAVEIMYPKVTECTVASEVVQIREMVSEERCGGSAVQRCADVDKRWMVKDGCFHQKSTHRHSTSCPDQEGNFPFIYSGIAT